MNNNNSQQVSEQNINNLLMLLDGALRYTQYARQGIEQNDAKLRNENISKAISIFTQLDAALDKSVGGEIAENLSGLYKFLMNQLTQANIQEDASLIDGAEKVLKDIKEAFEGAAKNIQNANNNNVNQNTQTQGRGLTIDI
ncbi:MAG: Flagellar protein fliS [Candidatus Magnetoglobus multicellularis str. Araruama]|uniref:Flagellar secretion chaperone FliS n=1 Tax=Candidatus Magnetoglobus multicellularis str. Araruama TaxID=890399 RepID=A0A1V1PH38_9BACT|nr:MAG: Flagellar protein fliS [Candidatus Magnetoglobus multicellularis str. Araruama]